MARSEIIQIAKTMAYGPGLGEKPSIRRAAASATLATGSGVSTFSLLAGEGAHVRAGDVLAARGTATAATAYEMQVIGVATDAVTVVTTGGSPALPADFNAAVFEQNPYISELSIHRSLSAIIANWLYPAVFEIDVSQTVTPNLATYQVEVPATTREVLGAYQVVSGIVQDIGFGLVRNVHATISTTGVLLQLFELCGADTIYLSLIREYTDATTNETVQYMMATGAAALAADGTIAEAQLESSKRDNRERRAEDAASALFRSFLTQRQAMAEDLSRDTLRLVISR